MAAPTQDHFRNRRLLLKENEAEARERLRAFWAGSSLGRPVLQVTVKGGPVPPLPAEEERYPDHKARQWDPKFMGECTDCFFTHTTQRWLAESMPWMGMGPASCLGLPALLLGATAYDDGSTSWINPLPDLYARPLPVFDPQAPLLATLRRLVQAQIDNVKGRAIITPPIFLDPLTTLSLLRTPEQLCLDVVERPDVVHRWRDALTDLTLRIYEWMYQLLLAHGHGEAGAFFALMAEGRMEAVQCDFAVMLSTEQFETFVMPYLRPTTDYMDFSLYHLDGTCQMRFLDLLRALPKLNGIQWNPEPPAGSPLGWFPAFHEIRRRGFNLVISCTNVDEAIAIARELGPDGLALFLPTFDTREQAEEAIRRVAAAC